jgi:UDPglucose 6-dehydrogenase
MKVSIIGTGYVGLVTGTCLADYGNDVYCVDVDADKIENLKKGIISIYEPGLNVMVQNNYEAGRLKFTTDIQEALINSNICFIAVGTPMGEDSNVDLQYILAVAESIGNYMAHHMYVVDKSTVSVGTAERVRRVIQKQLNLRKKDLTFDVISNPEFQKEGVAVTDCSHPDRIIIGADSIKAAGVMKELYLPFVRNTENIIFMDIPSAEMTKYAANAMLATKISFMNEIANICERVGADVNKVRRGIGSDTRIGYHFIYPGCGYGGSCFPKDVEALIKTSKKFGYEPSILPAVEKVNQNQKLVIPAKIMKRFGDNLEGKTFCIWGLAFKPDTDDMREAPSVLIINELVKHGATIRAYDPKAVEQAQTCYLKDIDAIEYCKTKYDALLGCDALVLVTEWKEFRAPDFMEIKMRLNNAIIFDGRNQYDKHKLKDMGFEYYQIGVGR